MKYLKFAIISAYKNSKNTQEERSFLRVFAKRTVAALIRCVARNVVRGEDIMDGNTVHVRNGTKYGAYAFEIAAVILNAFHAAANADAGRHGSHEEYDVFLAHHGFDIFSKEIGRAHV